ncbi:MAG: phenylalanine--tRNA ligase subunit alpha [bacterium]
MLVNDIEQALGEVERASSLAELETAECSYLGREGSVTLALRDLKDVPDKERAERGKELNELKNRLETAISHKQLLLKGSHFKQQIDSDRCDLTLPGVVIPKGHLHPLTLVENELKDIFRGLGFMVLDGPEVESDFYNFEALNIPPSHPARDTQDTFYLQDPGTGLPNKDLVLRTHTSPVQVRAMLKYGVPIRAVAPGRVFRNEATDASHEHTFDQMEGLLVDKDISIANMLAVMRELLAGIFKREVTVRLRPGYFPFVEPGFEMDMSCLICDGKGCPVCKQSGWVEILPCGLVHPKVLLSAGVDPEIYSGFAFGLGLTRLVMMRYGIDDIRLLANGSLGFLEQF